MPDGDVIGESAVFNTAVTVNYDVASMTNPITLQFDTGSGVTINPALPANTISLATLNQNAGTNVVAAKLTGNVTGSVSSGTLRLTNNAASPNNNDITGTITVNTGTTLEARPIGTSNPLGTTAVNLNGGTLEVTPGISARYAQIVNNGTTARPLAIGEFEVFAYTVNPGAPITSNLAATVNGGSVVAAQTTTLTGGHGSNAALIDLAEQTGAATFNTGTLVGSKATIDLGSTKDVGMVRFHQRNDSCCQIA